jgi:hypothetical protein
MVNGRVDGKGGLDGKRVLEVHVILRKAWTRRLPPRTRRSKRPSGYEDLGLHPDAPRPNCWDEVGMNPRPHPRPHLWHFRCGISAF